MKKLILKISTKVRNNITHHLWMLHLMESLLCITFGALIESILISRSTMIKIVRNRRREERKYYLSICNRIVTKISANVPFFRTCFIRIEMLYQPKIWNAFNKQQSYVAFAVCISFHMMKDRYKRGGRMKSTGIKLIREGNQLQNLSLFIKIF